MWKKLEFRAGCPAPVLPLRAFRRPFLPVLSRQTGPGWLCSGLGSPLLSPKYLQPQASFLWFTSSILEQLEQLPGEMPPGAAWSSYLFLRVSCPWPTQAPTPTAPNSSFVPQRQTGELLAPGPGPPGSRAGLELEGEGSLRPNSLLWGSCPHLAECVRGESP